MSGPRTREPPAREGSFAADVRAATPAVSKVFELAIVVLYIGVMTTALYGGVVPEYRDAAGARVGDRALATAAGGVENSVPATETATRVDRQVRIDLPDTIRGEGYWLRVDGEAAALVMDHPRTAVGGRLPLALPASVHSVSGRWSSYEPAVVAVTGTSDRLRVRLVRG